MSKSTITVVFIGAVLAAVTGLVIACAAVVTALAAGAVTLGGPNVVSVDGPALGGMLVWLVVSAIAFGIASLGTLAAWIGALVNTYRLEDKTWFAAILVLGLLSIGWVATAAYLVAGPGDPQRDPTNTGSLVSPGA